MSVDRQEAYVGFGRSTLLLLIATTLARLFLAPKFVVDGLWLVTYMRLLMVFPPSALAATVRASARSR
jgi:hypothetical protein